MHRCFKLRLLFNRFSSYLSHNCFMKGSVNLSIEEIKRKNILCNVILGALAWIDECSGEEKIDLSCKKLVKNELNQIIDNLNKLKSSGFSIAVKENGIFKYISETEKNNITTFLIGEIVHIVDEKLHN